MKNKSISTQQKSGLAYLTQVIRIVIVFCALGIFGFGIYKIFSYKMPMRIYTSEKSGIIVKDSLNNGQEWYVFKNTTNQKKIILGMHFEPMVVREQDPLFKVILDSHTSNCISVNKGFTDQIRICDFDFDILEYKPIAYINAARLRNGHKD